MSREHGESSSDYHSKNKDYEFSMPYHKEIPNPEVGSSRTINTINIDCIFDLQKRQEVIDKWNTEISLIIQSNPNEFASSKAVLLLIEHKSAGIIKDFIRKTFWNEDMHGEDTFDTIIKALYENAPREISVTIANEDTILKNKFCKQLKIYLSGEPFIIPTVYQQESEQESERKKSESIPSKKAKGKEKSSSLIPVALEKSKNKVNEELQSSSSPEANGSGKGTSNPLTADSLPKTEKVSLRPSYAQIIHEPEKSEKTNSRFYVIFDGEHRGIYEDWSIVSRYVTGNPFPFKKYGSLLQAQQEATRFSAEFGKKEIP
ncbi:hypothetical protein E3N88_28753 [Mikania micrantha]|uniref:Uncharacterized protein n=1 Tax=Mikania micrantha TaxID=192012 RepID=A0A5N6N3A0_9ASTR|nr:hypothetical protein E3N88_28753 [Mikania micrantha]